MRRPTEPSTSAGAGLKTKLIKAWPIATGALLLLAAFAPLNLGFLVFAALAPWLLSLREASGWGSFRSGYVFGLIFMGGQLHWIHPFVEKWTHSFALALVPWLLATAVGAVFFGGAGWLIRLCWMLRSPWMIPLVWAGVEVFRSYCPVLAFPWGLVANPLWPYPPIIQGAHFGTIYLVSAWVVLMNVILAQFLAGEGFAKLRVPLLAFIVLLGLSLVHYSTPAEGEKKIITIGQPGVDMAFQPDGRLMRLREAVKSIIDSARRQGADLLVLHEGLVVGGSGFPPALFFPVDPDVPILFGGQRKEGGISYQTAYGYDGEWKYADKTRLVIFGEFVPGRDWIPFLSSFNLPGGDLTASDHVKAIDVNGIRVGPMICFEGLFFDVANEQAKNGAQLLAVMSIDDWYMGTTAPEQLKAASVWRAVETGLPLVRSASLGYSLFVDARGNLLAEAPLTEKIAMRVEVALPKEPQRFPIVSVFPYAALASCFLLPLWAVWRARRRETPGA